MRTASLAKASGIDPLDRRFTGRDYSRHEPHYATRIRSWLSQAAAILESPSKAGEAARSELEACLSGEDTDPHIWIDDRTGKQRWLYGVRALPALYQSFELALEREYSSDA